MDEQEAKFSVSKRKSRKIRKSKNILNFCLIKQTQIKMKVNKAYNSKKNCLKTSKRLI